MWEVQHCSQHGCREHSLCSCTGSAAGGNRHWVSAQGEKKGEILMFLRSLWLAMKQIQQRLIPTEPSHILISFTTHFQMCACLHVAFMFETPFLREQGRRKVSTQCLQLQADAACSGSSAVPRCGVMQHLPIPWGVQVCEPLGCSPHGMHLASTDPKFGIHWARPPSEQHMD